MDHDLLAQHVDAIYSLSEFVDVVNGLLPAYLPKDVAGRAAEDVTPRLVRFYTTEGLLPEAHREGREARYSFDHLLALLAVRKLLAEGFGSAAIKRATTGSTRAELKALLADEVQVQLAPASAAPLDPARAEFLRGVRARAGLSASVPATPTEGASQPGAPTTAAVPPAPTTWARVSIADGLELFVRDDFALPTTLRGDDALLHAVKVVLLQLEQKRKHRK